MNQETPFFIEFSEALWHGLCLWVLRQDGFGKIADGSLLPAFCDLYLCLKSLVSNVVHVHLQKNEEIFTDIGGWLNHKTGGMISPPQRLRGIEKDSDHFPLATGHGPFYLVKLERRHTFSPQNQWSFLVPLIGGRKLVITQLAICKWYIRLIYCSWVDYISPTTY